MSEKRRALREKLEKGEIDPKYILSPKLKKYVMCAGTKNFKTSLEIDRKIAKGRARGKLEMECNAKIKEASERRWACERENKG